LDAKCGGALLHAVVSAQCLSYRVAALPLIAAAGCCAGVSCAVIAAAAAAAAGQMKVSLLLLLPLCAPASQCAVQAGRKYCHGVDTQN
jgi:hypothetical protein